MNKVDSIITALENKGCPFVSIKTPEIETFGMVVLCVKDRFRAGCAILRVQEDPDSNDVRTYQVTEDEIEIDF